MPRGRHTQTLTVCCCQVRECSALRRHTGTSRGQLRRSCRRAAVGWGIRHHSAHTKQLDFLVRCGFQRHGCWNLFSPVAFGFSVGWHVCSAAGCASRMGRKSKHHGSAANSFFGWRNLDFQPGGARSVRAALPRVAPVVALQLQKQTERSSVVQVWKLARCRGFFVPSRVH